MTNAGILAIHQDGVYISISVELDKSTTVYMAVRDPDSLLSVHDRVTVNGSADRIMTDTHLFTKRRSPIKLLPKSTKVVISIPGEALSDSWYADRDRRRQDAM